MVEISEEKNPDLSERYPILSWDPNNFGCAEINGKDYVYQLIRGLSSSGNMLIDNMIHASSYQTDPQDGEMVKYFTILWREKPEPPTPSKKSYIQILPWPGIFPGGLGWPSFSLTGGFPGGLPFPAQVGYPPGISRPSFPGMFPGFTFPGWRYPSLTSVPSYPFVFPIVGLFPSTWTSWPALYWNLSPGADPYNTVWFYPY